MFKKVMKVIGVAFLIFIGDLTLNVLSNKASSSQYILEFVHKAELFLGLSILEKEPLIETFHLQKPTYAIDENIQFDFKLKEKSFVYLLNISQEKSTLLFPNEKLKNKPFKKNKEYGLPKFSATKKGTEHFYLIASSSNIDADIEVFKKESININEAKALVENFKKNSNIIDVYRMDVKIK